MSPVGASFPYDEISGVLKSGQYSDFTIRCNACTFPVHRLVLYTKSDFFKAVLDNDFKEKKEGILYLSEYKPETVATTILYCYINQLHTADAVMPWSEYFTTIPKTSENDDLKTIESCHLLDVYMLADYLLLDDLKRKAGTQLFENLAGRPPKALILPVLQYAYVVLPDGDTNLRSSLTAWVVWLYDGVVRIDEDWRLDSDSDITEIAKTNDPAGFAAARFYRFMEKLGGSSKDAFARKFEP